MDDTINYLTLTIFDLPPTDPLALFADWFHAAREQGVCEPGALALATADQNGRTSSRIVQIIRITDTGLIFTTHTNSRKGRDIEATGWASGVLYWRETKQQVIVAGPAGTLQDAESDALWNARPLNTHPMSVASHQSAVLENKQALLDEVKRLETGQRLPRPERWCGYLLTPTSVEFWQLSGDGLHKRLRYDRGSQGWSSCRLQP
jgi:dihydrophenazinedicarboxylate synthase